MQCPRGCWADVDDFTCQSLRLYSAVYADKKETQVIHYVRQETKDCGTSEQGRLTEHEQFALLRVYRDPGSGKSTTVWGYMQFVGSGSPVAWVTQHPSRYQLALSSMEDAPTHENFSFIEFEAMSERLLLHNPTLLVLDEIIQNSPITYSLRYMLAHFIKAIKRKHHKCFFVICTSLLFSNHYGAYLTGVPYDVYFVCGWTVKMCWQCAVPQSERIYHCCLLRWSTKRTTLPSAGNFILLEGTWGACRIYMFLVAII